MTIVIPNTPERIHIQNTTFEHEYGTIVEYRARTVIIELTIEDSPHFEKGTKFRRSFSKKTGLSNGNCLMDKEGRRLKILF
mgnify:CR=1 FL=1|tara:strand:- start:673 stop:915 length:243 start_codon:yes stop_codon:yes gene_type:complete